MKPAVASFVNKCIHTADAFEASRFALSLREFFLGKTYPAVFATLVFVGHVTGLELYINIILMGAAALSLLVSRSARPLIIPFLTFVFQVSRQNAPGVPSFSDYYFEGYRLAIFVITMVCLVPAFAYFLVRRGCFGGVSFKSVPLLLPLLVMSASLSLNGIFSPSWQVADLVWGVLQGICLTGVFLFFYLGLRREVVDELVDYFVYASALVSLLLLAEIGSLYVFEDSLFVGDAIVKSKVLFGWGIWNSAGAALAVLIPVLFLGAMRSNHSLLYFALATATLGGILLTQSRGALLFGGLAYLLSLALCCFFGKRRVAYRIILGTLVLGIIALSVAFRNSLSSALSTFFADNGRFELWRVGLENFASSPIFGVGFYGFEYPDDPTYFEAASFLPSLAHNTPITLLSGSGIVGLVGYLGYRTATVIPFLKRPTREKTMLGLSALVLILMSLLDNFVFCFWNTFHYSIALAIVALIRDGQRASGNLIK